jgi:ABC-2 type transport system permease protein
MLAKFWVYIKLTFEVVKLSILSAMEYRASFITQIWGMAVNDLFLIFLWSVFFSRFPDLNGWQVQDTMLLFAVGMTNFGIYRIIAGNTEEISRSIIRGELDYYMTLPKSVLWQVSTAKSNISAIGDFLFGIIVFLFVIHSWDKFLLYLLLSVITAVTIYSFVVIVHSMAFFFGNFEETAERIFSIMLGLSLYPETTFGGVVKFITFTFIPVFFFNWMPVRLIQSFNWIDLIYLVLFAIMAFILARWFFNRGLRRYESGNLINVKM